MILCALGFIFDAFSGPRKHFGALQTHYCFLGLLQVCITNLVWQDDELPTSEATLSSCSTVWSLPEISSACLQFGRFMFFLYAVLYYNTRLELRFTASVIYFSYMFLISLSFFLLAGSVGFLSCFWFVRVIFGSIKVD